MRRNLAPLVLTATLLTASGTAAAQSVVLDGYICSVRFDASSNYAEEGHVEFTMSSNSACDSLWETDLVLCHESQLYGACGNRVYSTAALQMSYDALREAMKDRQWVSAWAGPVWLWFGYSSYYVVDDITLHAYWAGPN